MKAQEDTDVLTGGTRRLAREDEAAVRDLHATYWARTDGRDPAFPEDLFTDDASFVLGNLTLRGQAELSAFFRKRHADQQSSGRVTRHLSTDLTCTPLAKGKVATTSTVLAIAGYGPLPIQSSAPSIADFSDICARQADGRWLFERRTAAAIFAGPDAPGFARAPSAPSQAIKKEEEC